MSCKYLDHVILLLFVVALFLSITISMISIITYKRKKTEFYGKIRNFNLALLLFTVVSLAGNYRVYYILSYPMQMCFGFCKDISYVIMYYFWACLALSYVEKEKYKRLSRIFLTALIVFSVFWRFEYMFIYDNPEVQNPEYRFLYLIISYIITTVIINGIVWYGCYKACHISENKNIKVFMLILCATMTTYDLLVSIFELHGIFNDVVTGVNSCSILYIISLFILVVVSYFLIFRMEMSSVVGDKREVYINITNNELEMGIEKIAREFMLTDREKEIAYQVVIHKSNAQIAEELYISVGTVKKHMHNIFMKTSVSSREELRDLVERNISDKE